MIFIIYTSHNKFNLSTHVLHLLNWDELPTHCFPPFPGGGRAHAHYCRTFSCIVARTTSLTKCRLGNTIHASKWIYPHFFVLITAEYRFAFKKYNNVLINSMGVPYDFLSVMHYGMKTFSQNGGFTIIPRDSAVRRLGGNRLSLLDIKQTNLLYGCAVGA